MKTPRRLPPPENLGLEALSAPPPQEGISLNQLSAAFASMLESGHDPYSGPPPNDGHPLGESAAVDAPAAEHAGDSDDACEVSPRSILEAMLFVGAPDNQPLSSEQVAGLMRGVRPAEIDELVRDLNQQYQACGCPYQIRSEGAGYRMALREEFHRVRDKFYSRMRQARLSPAAIEVLSIIAYRGPQTADQIAQQRGTPSGAVLTQLVRRQLLSVERPESSPRKPCYHTTQRFLDLFGLRSLGDLPRGQELDKR